MLANANAVLSRLGRPALASISEVLAGCTSLLYGLPAFDPYLQLRRTLTLGLLGDTPKSHSSPSRAALGRVSRRQLPWRRDDHAGGGVQLSCPPMFTSAARRWRMRRFLEQQPNVTVWNDHAALLEAARKCQRSGASRRAGHCATLHLAGSSATHYPVDTRAGNLNHVMGWMGFTWMKPPDVSIEEMAGTFRDIVRDLRSW